MNEETSGGQSGGSTTGSGGEGEPLPDLIARIGQVFFSPGALFDRLKRNPVWVGILVLLVVISFGSNLLVPEEIFRQALEAQMGEEVEPEQVEQALGFVKIWGRAMAVVGPPLMIAAIAGLLILIFNVLMGGEATYRQLFSATAHSFVIYTVGGLITLALILARGDVDVSLSLGLLVPGLEGYPGRFLGRLNVFSLWTAAVLGIAVSRLYPGRSSGSAAGLLIGVYAVLVAIFAAFGG